MLSERTRLKRLPSTMIALYKIQNQERSIHAARSQESDFLLESREVIEEGT